MKSRTHEGIYIALVPQRGAALLDLLREAARQFLGSGRQKRGWVIEFGQVRSPAGAVAFRLTSPDEPFPWGDGQPAELARLVSKQGPGRCWVLAIERGREGDGWAEGVAFDRGERAAHEEAQGAEAAADLVAWFGEQLALSENEVGALFEARDQTAPLEGGEEHVEDEIDQILDRARKEFQRYQQLKEERERSQS